MTIKPFGRRVHYKPIEQTSFIETTDRRLTEVGTVVAVGPDVKHLKVGDNVIFNVYGTNTPTIDGEMVFFALEDDEVILGTYERE